jgi:hypothetical protein
LLFWPINFVFGHPIRSGVFVDDLPHLAAILPRPRPEGRAAVKRNSVMTNALPVPRRGPAIVDLPEFNIVVFGFLLTLPWEMLQVPFYAAMMTAPHWPAVKFCTVATVGDAVIMLFAFWGVAIGARSRRWIVAPTRPQVAAFIALGLAATLLIEQLATRAPWGWRYSALMPVDPLLGIALVPVLMWLIVPLVVLWFVKRQPFHAAVKDLP